MERGAREGTPPSPKFELLVRIPSTPPAPPNHVASHYRKNEIKSYRTLPGCRWRCTDLLAVDKGRDPQSKNRRLSWLPGGLEVSRIFRTFASADGGKMRGPQGCQRRERGSFGAGTPRARASSGGTRRKHGRAGRVLHGCRPTHDAVHRRFVSSLWRRPPLLRLPPRGSNQVRSLQERAVSYRAFASGGQTTRVVKVRSQKTSEEASVHGEVGERPASALSGFSTAVLE